MDRHRMHFGPYKTPRFRYGAIVHDAARGDVVIVGMTDAPIPWPLARRVGRASGLPSLVLYRSLVKAVQRESAIAVAHWWGVSPWMVNKWRKALGVSATTEGTSRIRAAHAKANPHAIQKAQEKSRDPAQDAPRRAKIAAAKQGKPRPPHVLEALRKSHVGKRLPKSTRAKMSEAHRKRGTRPPWLNQPWTEEEDELLRTLPAKEAAARTGRTLSAVHTRRRRLGLPDGRKRR